MNFWERKGQKEEIKEIEGKALIKEKHICATEMSKLERQGRDRMITDRWCKCGQSRKSGSAYQIEVEGSGC